MCAPGGRRGQWNEGQCPEILELGPLKRHFLILRPKLCKSAVVIYRQQFKTFNSNNFTLSSTFSVQNTWPIKINAVYTLLLFHIFIHFLVRIGLDHSLRIFENKLFYFSKPSSGCRPLIRRTLSAPSSFPNPYPISDQNMSFSHLFLDLVSKICTSGFSM